MVQGDVQRLQPQDYSAAVQLSGGHPVSDSEIVTFALIAAVAGIAYGLYLAMWVFKLDAGNAKMQEISKAIQEGAGAYMNRQYKTVGVVAAVLFVGLAGAGAVSDKFGILTAVGFL